MHIGIAGVGRMGANMGLRLMETGQQAHGLESIGGEDQAAGRAGAAVAKTPAELASAVETVITILTNAAAIDAVYHGPQGLLSGDVKGKLFIEMSTVPPDVRSRSPKRCAPRVRPTSSARSAAASRRRAQASCSATDGRGAGRRGAGEADPRQLCRRVAARRSGRHRRGAQARRQPAADDLLAGAGRAACAVQGCSRSIRRSCWISCRRRPAPPTC